MACLFQNVYVSQYYTVGFLPRGDRDQFGLSGAWPLLIIRMPHNYVACHGVYNT